MKKKENLFRLIKALSISEKKHFRKTASLHVIGGENDYVKLFDVLDKQKEYNPEELRNALKGEPLLNHLAASNYYLYKLILKSIRSLHSEDSVESRLRGILTTIEVLFEKGLFDDVRSLIGKAKHMAEKYECFLVLIELLKWENKLIVEQKDMKSFEKVRKANLKEIRYLAKKELLELEMSLFRDPFIAYYTKVGKTQASKQLSVIFNEQKRKLKGLEEGSLSFNSKKFIHIRNQLYYMLIEDYTKSYAWAEKTIRLLESNPHFLYEDPMTYLQSFAQQITCLSLKEKYNECLKIVNKLKAVSTLFPASKKESIERYIFSTINLELAAYTYEGLFREGIEAAGRMEMKVQQFRGKISKFILVPAYYNASFLCFIICDFSTATKWINKILSNREAEGYMKYILCCARMLNLMIHFEKGNNELLQYLSRSSSRYLQKRGKLYQCELVFLSSIRRLSLETSPAGQYKLFKTLKDQLMEFKDNPEEWKIIEQLEIIIWMESKLSGKSFEELYLKKVREAKP